VAGTTQSMRGGRGILGESQRGSGENRCGSRGPLELPPSPGALTNPLILPEATKSSSSSKWSRLRSISSRRRRISERLLSENSPKNEAPAGGGHDRLGPQLAEQIKSRPWLCGCGGFGLCFFPHTLGPMPVSRFDPSLSFVGSRQKIVIRRQSGP
jgi:hypothetical protein